MLTACLEVLQAAVCVCVEPEMLLTSAPITMKTRRRVACGGLWGERAAYSLPCAAKFLNFSLLIYFSPPSCFVCGASLQMKQKWRAGGGGGGNTSKSAAKNGDLSSVTVAYILIALVSDSIKADNAFGCDKAALTNGPWTRTCRDRKVGQTDPEREQVHVRKKPAANQKWIFSSPLAQHGLEDERSGWKKRERWMERLLKRCKN